MFDEFNFLGDVEFERAAVMLETFVYCSRAAESVDDAEVSRLSSFLSVAMLHAALLACWFSAVGFSSNGLKARLIT